VAPLQIFSTKKRCDIDEREMYNIIMLNFELFIKMFACHFEVLKVTISYSYFYFWSFFGMLKKLFE
jgi:hypothetical protein